jgi:hypothetical protein
MSNPVLAPAIGTPDGALDEFNTPSAYYPGTLRCYLNGQLIRNTDDDGIIELGGTSVRHKIPPLTNDVIDYYYHESAPTGGAIQGPPDMLEAFELQPEIYAIVDLRPDIIGAEDQTPEEQTPQMIGNEHLAPEIVSALDLRPEIISVEEV